MRAPKKIFTTWEGLQVPLPDDASSRLIIDRVLTLADKIPFPAFRLKKGKLHAAEIVGCIQIGDVRINVLPKVDTPEPVRDANFLLNILRKAGYLSQSHSKNASVRSIARDPLEMIIAEAAAELNLALLEGIPRRYEKTCENTSTLRGRINLSELSTRLPGTPSIPVCHMLLSSNNKLAKGIRTISSILFQLTKSGANRKIFASALAQLEVVGKGSLSREQLNSLVLSSSEMKWKKFIELGKLIMNGHSPDPTFSGKNEFCSIIFPLQHLYERAMRKILVDAAIFLDISVTHRTEPVFLITNTELKKDALRLKPDFVFIEQKKIIALGDAKWKRVSEAGNTYGLPREDLYQITSYLSRYKIDTAIVFVPRANWMPAGWVKTLSIQGTDSNIHLIGVDIENLVSQHPTTRSAALSTLSLKLSEIIMK